MELLKVRCLTIKLLLWIHLFVITAGKDYTAVTQSVKFSPGQSITSVNVTIIDDDIGLEPNIDFTVTIIAHGDVNVIVLSNSTVTIVDDDHSKLNNTIISAI